MPLSTRLNGPPGFDPTASRAATLASGVLPLRLRQRPEASTRFAISLACRGSPAWRRTSRVTSRADSPFAFRLAIVVPPSPRRSFWGGAVTRESAPAQRLVSGPGGRWERQRCRGWGWGRTGECPRLVEEAFELLADLAAAGVAVLPLMGVDAQGGVGFAVPEAALHVGDGVVERDQHAGVAVPQVMQARVGERDTRRRAGALQRRARDLALQTIPAATGEHIGAGVEERAPLGEQAVEAAHQ